MFCKLISKDLYYQLIVWKFPSQLKYNSHNKNNFFIILLL